MAADRALASMYPLQRVALKHDLVIGSDRKVMATHISVLPLQGGAQPEPLHLLAAIRQFVGGVHGPVWLRIGHSEQLLCEMLRTPLASNFWMEIPAFLAAQPHIQGMLVSQHARGRKLVLHGATSHRLPAELLALFNVALIEAASDRRSQVELHSPNMLIFKRRLPFVLSDVATQEDVQSAFCNGATAILGWPTKAYGVAGVTPRIPALAGIVVETLAQLDRGESIDRLAASLERHPWLLHTLLRYARLPIMGIPVRAQEFNEVALALGYQRLRQLLLVLLVESSCQGDMAPVMEMSLRRAFLMEKLTTDDRRMQMELFLCGLLSHMNTLWNSSFHEVFQNISVPVPVHIALTEGSGPYSRHCKLMAAVEHGGRDTIQGLAHDLGMDCSNINTALLKSISAVAGLRRASGITHGLPLGR